MKVKKDKKTVFWFSIVAIVLFIVAKVIGIINNEFNTMDTIMDVLMIVVVVNCLITSCIEKK